MFTLDDCAPIVGSDVISFNKKDEAKMLQVYAYTVCCTFFVHVYIIYNIYYYNNKSMLLM